MQVFENKVMTESDTVRGHTTEMLSNVNLLHQCPLDCQQSNSVISLYYSTSMQHDKLLHDTFS
jgi:hypothetical protein